MALSSSERSEAKFDAVIKRPKATWLPKLNTGTGPAVLQEINSPQQNDGMDLRTYILR
jgi:hypothetical protein